MKVLVTGGSGYIGSHTIVDLIDHNILPVSVDNFSRSSSETLEGIQKICKQSINNYDIDISQADELRKIFELEGDITGIIHFAAFKFVGESVKEPLLYYRNNLNGLINLLDCVKKYNIQQFVFSSSCTVYGNPDQLPVNEQSPILPSQSPYGATKQMSEQIIRDFAQNSSCKFSLLRYFNPIGAHPSAMIGEGSKFPPENLMPILTETALGLRKSLTVFGGDYPTRDGTCVRDYIHVMDIAHAHTKALSLHFQNQNVQTFNLGSGQGVTVLELISAFEKATGIKLNYEIGERRPGDVVAVYADNRKAKEVLGWELRYSLEEMMSTAWRWQLKKNA